MTVKEAMARVELVRVEGHGTLAGAAETLAEGIDARVEVGDGDTASRNPVSPV